MNTVMATNYRLSTMRFVYVLILLFLTTGNAYARYYDVDARHFTIDDGLSNNTIFSIAQDQQGFLWFGSKDGLHRYDGYEFTVYSSSDEQSSGLSNDDIAYLFVDSKNTLWIGNSDGLNRYDSETDSFTLYAPTAEKRNFSFSNRTFVIYEDSKQNLWIGTRGAGLFRFDREKKVFTRYQHDPEDSKSLGEGSVWGIAEDSKGYIWAGIIGGGLNRLDTETGHVTRYEHQEDNPNSLSHNNVMRLYMDEGDILWIGTYGGGLNRLDIAKQKFTRFQYDPQDPHSISSDAVFSIHKDQQGIYWVGTDGGGLNRFDPQKRQFTKYKNQPGNISSIGDNGIWFIHQDQENILWLATDGGGISKVITSKNKPLRYKHDPTNTNSLSNNHVSFIYEDSNGILWAGTENGALNKIKRKEGQIKHFLPDPTNPNGLRANAGIRKIVEDHDGYLWIGQWAGGGLTRFDPETEHFQHFEYDPKDPGSLSNNNILSLFVDSNNKLWIGTQGGGLNRFLPQTGKFERYTQKQGGNTALSDNNVSSIYQDRLGNLWIGTWYGGLNRLDPDTGTFYHYQNKPGQAGTISAGNVNTINEDHVGNLWIGTEYGLNLFERETGTFITYSEIDGLPNRNIHGILNDLSENLWLCTPYGLSKFNPHTVEFRTFDTSIGLRQGHFNPFVHHQNKHGEIFFGGHNGLSIFSPNEMEDNSHVPPVVINELRLFNKKVNLDSNSALKKTIWETNQLTLDYTQRIISFGFSALSFLDPESNRYRYKLEGFDDEWNEVGSERRLVTFTNLAPGEYTFNVQGSNNDGTWNEQGASLSLTITPPWWATWWFRALSIVLLTVLTFLGYRWRTYAITKHNQTLEEEVNERTDELRLAKKKLEKRYSIGEQLNKIGKQFLEEPIETLDELIVDTLNAACEISNTHIAWLATPDSSAEQNQAQYIVTYESINLPDNLRYPFTHDEGQLAFKDVDFPWINSNLRRGKKLILNSINDIPDAYLNERKLAEGFGIKALLYIPILDDNEELCSLCINDFERTRPWDEELIHALEMLAQFITAALRRKSQLEAIRKNENLMRELIDFAPVPILAVTKASNECRYLNKKFSDTFGYTLDDVPNLEAWQQKAYPDKTYRRKVRQKYLQANRDNSMTTWVTVTCKDGSEKIVETNFSELDDLEIAAMKDITEYKQAEKVIRDREKELSQFFDSGLVGTAIYSADKKLVRFNDTLCDMIGYTREEFGQLMWHDVTHPDDLEQDDLYFNKLNSGEFDKCRFEKRYLHKQGDIVYINIWASCVRKKDGSIDYLYCLIQDITEQKQAEKALTESEAVLNGIVNFTPVPIMSMNEAGELRFINQSFIDTFGYAASDLPTLEAWRELAYPDREYREKLKKIFKERELVISREEEYEVTRDAVEVVVTCKDGSQRTVETKFTGFHDIKIGTFNDVTERKKAEDELRQAAKELKLSNRELTTARQEAEAASIAKSQFLASMSHELRTPLNSIIGFSELLQNTPELEEQCKQHVDIINQSGDHLLALINDILDMAKIEAGHITLEENDIELRSFLDSLTMMIRLRAERKSLELEHRYAETLPDFICVDELKLRQVLMNLLSNAIKFTDKGCVTLKVNYLYSDNDNQPGQLSIEVHDTGYGIAAEELDTLFQPFTQTEAGKRSQEGTGLGLSLSKRFVEAMGGELTVSSEVNLGSVFRFTIPTPEVDTGTTIQTLSRGMRRLAPGTECTVLIAEDIEYNQILLVNLLENAGFSTLIANNGEQGVALFQQHQPDLILMDILMPVMDGKIATQHIRQLPGGDQVKIIAVTASAFKDERQDILDAGCDDTLFKPFRETDLFKLIQQQLHLEFIYINSETAERPATIAKAPSAELLQQLPRECLEQVRQAALEGDIDMLQVIIEELPEEHESVREYLSKLVKGFEFESILSL